MNPYYFPRDTVRTPPPPQTQDESVNTVQKTQFKLFLLVTPYMPHINSKKSVNCSPSPTPHPCPYLPQDPLLRYLTDLKLLVWGMQGVTERVGLNNSALLL